MKKTKTKFIILITVFFVSYICTVFYAGEMRVYSGKISIYNNFMGITVRQAIAIQQKNTLDRNSLNFCFWNEQVGVSVKNANLNKEYKGALLEVVGRADILFQKANTLDESDYGGCIIDYHMSDNLFGSRNVVGKNVSYGRKQYIIRGIVEQPKDTMIIQMEPDSERTPTTLTVAKGENTDSNKIVNYLHTNYEIEGTVLEYDLINDLVRVFLVFIPIIFLFVLLCEQVHYGRNLLRRKPFDFDDGKKNYFICVITTVFLILGILLFVFNIDNIFDAYGDYLPSKWSDFGFWSELFEGKVQGLIKLMKIPKTGYDLYYYFSFYKVFFSYIISIGLLLKLSRMFHQWNIRERNEINDYCGNDFKDKKIF